MVEKIKALLGSIRFWQLVLAAAGVQLSLVADHGFVLKELLQTLAGLLTAVSAVGTVDRLRE